MSIPTPTAARTAGPPAAANNPRSSKRHYNLWRADFVIGSTIIAFWVLCALFPALLTSLDPTSVDMTKGLSSLGEPLPPGTEGHWLGTDPLGRDELSRLVYGAQVALLMAVVPNAIALLLAVLVGVTAGVVRGKVEFVLMRCTEAVMVLPGFLIAMAVVATFGTSTTVLVFTLVAFSWTYPTRVVYGETLKLREMLFVEAARSMGASSLRLALTHIVPHLRALLIVYFTMNAAFMVLLEASLGFLGFGVQPPTPSWGLMLAEARDQFFYPWLMVLPGICLASLCIGFYLMGQGIENAGKPVEQAVRL